MRFAPVFISLLATVVGAWPIFFYETNHCNHYPAFILEHAVRPGECHPFGQVDIRSYSGETRDEIEKVLLYVDSPTCVDDVALRVHANYTISHSSVPCTSIPQNKIPRDFVFIEELSRPKRFEED